MKGVEAAWLGGILILVPAIAWLFGRFAGRRDWPVTLLLVGSMLIGGGLYALMAMAQRMSTASDPTLIGWPEIPGFLIVFAGFVSLIGWAGTPVAKRGTDTPRH